MQPNYTYTAKCYRGKSVICTFISVNRKYCDVTSGINMLDKHFDRTTCRKRKSFTRQQYADKKVIVLFL